MSGAFTYIDDGTPAVRPPAPSSGGATGYTNTRQRQVENAGEDLGPAVA